MARHGAATVVGKILVAVVCAAIGSCSRVLSPGLIADLAIAAYLLAKGVLEGMIACKFRRMP